MRSSQVLWIVISGIVWFVVGIGLLTLGMHFIIAKAQLDLYETRSLIFHFSSLTGGREEAAFALIDLGLLMGFLKGRFVLSKTVKRVVARIVSLPEPLSVSQIYSKGYLALIGGMVLLGISMKWTGIPVDIRGVVDVAIGSALMNGASAYFRAAFAVHKGRKSSSSL